MRMNLNCISWNIRGLESLDRKFISKRMCKEFGNIDIVVLHEVKAICFILDTSLNMM